MRKSAVTLLVTEHADRVGEALNRTIDALVSVDAHRLVHPPRELT